MKEWNGFFLSHISNYVYRRKCGNRKSPFEMCHSNGCFTQEWSVDAKISGWQYDKTGYLYDLKISPHNILLNYKYNKLITTM